MKLALSLVLATCLLGAPAHAEVSQDRASIEAQVASCHAENAKEVKGDDAGKLLQPGFRFFIKPTSGPESITGVVTQWGIAFCAAEPTSQLQWAVGSDTIAKIWTPTPGNCNTVITPPFLTVPVSEFLRESGAVKNGFKAVFKFLVGSSVASAQYFTAGLAGGVFQSLNGIVNPDPLGAFLDQTRITHDIDAVLKYRKLSCDKGDGQVVGAFVSIKSNHSTGQTPYQLVKQGLVDKLTEIQRRLDRKGKDELGTEWHDARLRNVAWVTRCFGSTDGSPRSMEMSADPQTWMYMDPLGKDPKALNCNQTLGSENTREARDRVASVR